jgi:hypothetical protein
MFNIGDEVAVYGMGVLQEICKVDSVTATLAKVGNDKYNRETGHIKPKGYWGEIYPVTDKHRHILKMRNIKDHLNNYRWFLLPDDLLLAIADILDQHEKNHGEGKE